MLNNFFKTAFRSLWKNRTYSFLNIAGLAIGIACAGLIFLWVEREMSYDKFNLKKDHIYYTKVNAVLDAGIFTHGSSPGVLAPAMQAEIPGIGNTCRTTEGETSLLFSVGDKNIYASGKYAEPSLFSIFTLPFVQGNAASAFSQLYSIVVTEKTAKKIFGKTDNLIGKSVRVDNKQDYVITGVLKDLPQNSSLQLDWVAPFQIWYQQSPWASKWENNCLSTYVELKPEANLVAINKQLYNFVQKKAPSSNGHVFLFNMNQWHLYDSFDNGKQTGGGRIETVRLFSMIAWIILFIACINFMNLATARSEKRAREVGVRKVLGAGKRILVVQFIGEALLMAALAAVGSIVIMTLVLPVFNMLVQKELLLELTNPVHMAGLLLITLICGLVAGSYPSLYLSSFNPVFVLKGIKLKIGSAAIIRKGLVVLQFTVSIVLIVSTIIIYRQIQHVKQRDLGLNKNNLLSTSVTGTIHTNFSSIRQDLLNTSVVENAALTDHSTITGGNNTDHLSWAGKPPGNRILISGRNVSPEFMSTSGIKIIEGRDLQVNDSVHVDGSSKAINCLVTQSMAKVMGKKSAIGEIIYNEGDPEVKLTIVGVVNDYVYGNMYGRPDPVIFMWVPPKYATQLYIRIKPQADLEKALAQIATIMKKDNPAYPFEYHFVDDQFNEMFSNEMLLSKLSRVFAALAIIISCLGLFGLAAYTAERRTKEIGIRKVLGASSVGLAGLLSKEFLVLVCLSCLIAFPLAWWMMFGWLQDFEYRIEISWWIFILAGLVAVIIALVTVSFQAIKAAMANPVRSLRTE